MPWDGFECGWRWSWQDIYLKMSLGVPELLGSVALYSFNDLQDGARKVAMSCSGIAENDIWAMMAKSMADTMFPTLGSVRKLGI